MKMLFSKSILIPLFIKWIPSFEKCFQSFFFFFLGKIIKCFISTLTSSFIGLFLASLCLILLIFRALQKCLRDLLHISFFLVSGGVTFLWSIGVSVAMSKRKRAPPFACANIYRVICNIWKHPCSPLYLYVYIYLVGLPETFNLLLHLMSFMALATVSAMPLTWIFLFSFLPPGNICSAP